MNKIGERFAGDLGKLQDRFGAETTFAAEAAALEKIKQLVEQTTRSVTSLTPPAKVKALHAKLVAELHQFDAVLADFDSALRSADASRVSTDQGRYSTVGNAIPNTFLDISLAAPD